jgi:hypothetical protein
MRLSSGNQLRAARALIGIDQIPLAALASVSVGTLKNMEKCGAGQLRATRSAIKCVQAALENLGVEFLNENRPGVRLRASTK